ncbi:peptidase inhibitor family I36 protein [Streptomyces sp. URMC 123]|uniref:peptidase inhibitor family I36 protein n=1 Tax=Streptomyces sp. URMC 123 TaxID=3423403 RepID=UPI003F19B1B7
MAQYGPTEEMAAQSKKKADEIRKGNPQWVLVDDGVGKEICPSGYVALYEDKNFNWVYHNRDDEDVDIPAGRSGGRVYLFRAGTRYLKPDGFNDETSSVFNNTDDTLRLFRHVPRYSGGPKSGLQWFLDDLPTGLRKFFTGDIFDPDNTPRKVAPHTELRRLDQGWNDAVSMVMLYKELELRLVPGDAMLTEFDISKKELEDRLSAAQWGVLCDLAEEVSKGKRKGPS